MTPTRAILRHLAEGRITELSVPDIQAAAAEALRLLDAGESREARIARVRQTHPHAFEPWSPGEDGDLLVEWRHGASVAALARAFGRPAGAIRMRLKKLGVDPRRRKADA